MSEQYQSPNQQGLARLLGLGVEAEGGAPEPEIEGFEMLSLLGAGGMGEVWRAVQLSTQRKVAVKLLASGTLRSDKARLRFGREVQVAARLEHPNIARVYESGLHRGLPYYVMELIDGLSLDRFVSRHELTPRQVLGLVRTTCRAVEFAHHQGVIHRDLKPANILVSADGQPHILDFGLAKTLTEPAGQQPTVSIDGEMTGTLAYMSPEQATGHIEQLDARTDVYSLGVILYRLLTGQPPHDLSGSQLEVQNRIASEEVRRPREVSRAVDRRVEAVLLRALAGDAQRRYASAGDLADDIDRYLKGEPLAARPPSPLARAGRWLSRRRVAIAVVVTLAGMFAAIALLGHMLLTRDRQPRLAVTPARPSPMPVARPSPPPLPAEPRTRVPLEKSATAANGQLVLDLGDGVTIGLVRVPAGRFLMGSPDSEPGRNSDEGPQRWVRISRPFYLSACEVTRGQFAAFTARSGYRAEAEREGWATIWAQGQWRKSEGASWRSPGFGQKDDHPVVCVSWNDAVAFCKWASAQSGRSVRLPTEAQWEYACRAGTVTAWPWGGRPDGGKGWCNGGDQSAGRLLPGGELFGWDDGYAFTSPVGRFKANAWGLCDMLGNVWEWCADWYGRGVLSPLGAADSTFRLVKSEGETGLGLAMPELIDPTGPADGTARVLRGDSWAGGPKTTRCAFRSRRFPDDRASHVGFRIAADAP